MVPRTRPNNSRGQATLEAAVVSAALVLWVGLLMGLIYFSVLKTYLQYSSHEFLVCREISDPWACESQFKKEIQNALSNFGRIEAFWVRQEHQKQVLTLKLKFKILKKEIFWNYKDQIQLPLKGS